MITIEYDESSKEQVNSIEEAESAVSCLWKYSSSDDLVIYDEDLNEYEVEWIAKVVPTGGKVVL